MLTMSVPLTTVTNLFSSFPTSVLTSSSSRSFASWREKHRVHHRFKLNLQMHLHACGLQTCNHTYCGEKEITEACIQNPVNKTSEVNQKMQNRPWKKTRNIFGGEKQICTVSYNFDFWNRKLWKHWTETRTITLPVCLTADLSDKCKMYSVSQTIRGVKW